ncbi:hypothetical protein AAKU55_005594 [Oxalobacteraceae bacterium GrIS 1.11]
MELRSAILKIIGAINGSWDVASAYVGLTPAALRNRAYEVKGQALSTEHSLALQALSQTTYFAEAIAAASGGTFVKLPTDLSLDNELLNKKFHDLYAELGTFSQHFTEATADDEIDKRERADLTAIADEMHKTISELLALTFRIYCRDDAKSSKKKVGK